MSNGYVTSVKVTKLVVQVPSYFDEVRITPQDGGPVIGNRIDRFVQYQSCSRCVVAVQHSRRSRRTT